MPVAPIKGTHSVLGVDVDDLPSDGTEITQKVQARYKVELQFSEPKIFSGPSQALCSIWESGSQLGGDADELLHFCPQKARKQGTCEEPLGPVSDGGLHYYCGYCGGKWKPTEVVGQFYYKALLGDFDQILERWFHRLGGNVDFYIIFGLDNLRKVSTELTAGTGTYRAVEQAYERRLRRIYRAESIMRTTATGRTLRSALRAFLTA